ncbi:GTP-binding protein engA [Flexistipes sinusarabici DSM 4947]|uniref:GTPase Der n=1 Tax=Flexistipes sinusarabici (strain ATCC 49648 / DSM 4947 / MAS 10) TaxID=717231 RepID=F8E507_FLESM|nr:ribosome biogenesis GTPase Der [Flexistipes sinusarabici]AEI15643.1 GTP-binding protein engA [Flexistipes sinusarabici DSM 4947]
MLKVGIIGRPNVGKSTLFNKITGSRSAIVNDMPGVTRDRLEKVTEWLGVRFTVVDSAGFDLKEEIIKKEMQQQFFTLLDEVDVCLLMVDVTEGVHSLDEIVCNLLREKGKTFFLVVNKVDSEKREYLASEFYRLGVSEMFLISSEHGRNVDMLLDRVLDEAQKYEQEEGSDEPADLLRLTIIGKPNVGKSSILNRILGKERVIVTEIPGTTRDAVDTYFTFESKNYVLTDTAGIRKKSVMFKDAVEKIGYYRGMDALERSDIAIAILDAVQGVTERDVKIIADAVDMGRTVIIVFNKWDLIKEDKKKTARDLQFQVKDRIKFITNPPIIFTSAFTGNRLDNIFKYAQRLYKEYSKRIKTAELNKLLQFAQERHQPPVVSNRRLKFFYMTQVDVKPPYFVIFVNYPEAVHFSYKRYILNLIREAYGFDGIPLRIGIRKRKGRDEK